MGKHVLTSALSWRTLLAATAELDLDTTTSLHSIPLSTKPGASHLEPSTYHQAVQGSWQTLRMTIRARYSHQEAVDLPAVNSQNSTTRLVYTYVPANSFAFRGHSTWGPAFRPTHSRALDAASLRRSPRLWGTYIVWPQGFSDAHKQLWPPKPKSQEPTPSHPNGNAVQLPMARSPWLACYQSSKALHDSFIVV